MAVKPLRYGACTEYVVVEDIVVYRGVGLSVGSVVAEQGGSCIRHVLFRNIVAVQALKFIYVKTGLYHGTNDSGVTGEISNVTYENMTAEGALLWPIYIGPQQQKEPDGKGDGFWPAVDPRVSVQGITLRNITITGNTLQAGVLRCNESSPCEDVHFDNVHVSGGINTFICRAVLGTYHNSTPRPRCLASPSNRLDFQTGL